MIQRVEILVGVTICYDHSPLFVFLNGQFKGQQGPRKFKFEAGRELNTKCRGIIENTWKGLSNQADPWRRLSRNME